MAMKYTAPQAGNNVWTGLLANANNGGENVHRGAVLGALLGVHAGMEAIPKELVQGLHGSAQIAEEIDAFVAAVMSPSQD
eukprot:gene7109-6728_t